MYSPLGLEGRPRRNIAQFVLRSSSTGSAGEDFFVRRFRDDEREAEEDEEEREESALPLSVLPREPARPPAFAREDDSSELLSLAESSVLRGLDAAA